MKREIPMIITALIGVIMIVAFFVPQPAAMDLRETIQKWAIIVFAFAILLGVLNLLLVNLHKVARGSSEAGYSIVLIISVLVTAFVGVVFGIAPETKATTWQVLGNDFTFYRGVWFDFIFQYMYIPLNSTVFSLLAFFIASAAFRAFRAKTGEATLLLVAAILVMLGRVPIGNWLWAHSLGPLIGAAWASLAGIFHGQVPAWVVGEAMSEIADWIMDFPNTAGQRAIIIGAGLGAVAVSLKILLGVERSYLGGE